MSIPTGPLSNADGRGVGSAVYLAFRRTRRMCSDMAPLFSARRACFRQRRLLRGWGLWRGARDSVAGPDEADAVCGSLDRQNVDLGRRQTGNIWSIRERRQCGDCSALQNASLRRGRGARRERSDTTATAVASNIVNSSVFTGLPSRGCLSLWRADSCSACPCVRDTSCSPVFSLPCVLPHIRFCRYEETHAVSYAHVGAQRRASIVVVSSERATSSVDFHLHSA